MNICLASTWKMVSLSVSRDVANKRADCNPMMVDTTALIKGGFREYQGLITK